MIIDEEIAALIPSCRATSAPTILDVSPELTERGEPFLRRHLPADYFVAKLDPVPAMTLGELFIGIVAAIGASIRIPSVNWHAMRDRLLDFTWLPTKPSGFVLLYRHPELLSWSDLSEFMTLADSVRATYAPHGKPFKVLMAKRLGS